MLTGVEGELKLRGVGLHRGYFKALGARVVSSAIWFVADVTIGAAADTVVEVAAGVSLPEWLDGSAGEGLGLASGCGGG